MDRPEPTRRIGVLIPPANFVCETEYPHAVPRRFSFHFNRLQRPEAAISAESFLAMKDSALSCAKGLQFAGIDVLAYASTSGSFLEGAGAHRDISDKLTSALRIPALTTSTAVLDTLGRLAQMEDRCGMPVVSSNSATVWAAVRTLDTRVPLPALGTLETTGLGQ